MRVEQSAMNLHLNRALRALLLPLLALWLAACSTTTHRAPVEDRSAGTPTAAIAAPAAAAAASAPVKLPPGAENAGKPGYYTVQPGDTLMRVALDSGQSWRDIARWNTLDNPNVLEVGQVLRVVPPSADANGVVVRPVLPTARADGHALAAAPAASGASASASALAAVPASATPTPPSAVAADSVVWTWPAAGAVVTPFDDDKNKGLTISGKAGDPVYAAADGRVVYAGSGLRGYGNLIIVKHNATYLSAYAHNQTLLVKEDQVVRRGQQIAEMGSSDATRVGLHFEIRRQGKPIDPATLLPPR
jgi:lipoprotein NlpD